MTSSPDGRKAAVRDELLAGDLIALSASLTQVLSLPERRIQRGGPERLRDIFRALAGPTRRAIFERLTCGEAAVKDLTARFNAVAKVGRCGLSFELIAL